MRKNQSTTTAEGIAIMRAIEARRPESERICYDPYARAMVSGLLYNLAKLLIDLDYSDFVYLQDARHGEVRRMRRAARVTGEKWVFGIPSGQIESFLLQRGFRDIHNVTPADLKRHYFTGPNAGREMASGYAIVSACVS